MEKEAAERAAVNAVKKKKAEERIQSERGLPPVPRTAMPATLGGSGRPWGCGARSASQAARAGKRFAQAGWHPHPLARAPLAGALAANEAILHQKRSDFETREAASEARRAAMDEERRAADARKRAEEEAKQAGRRGKYELSLQREEARKQVRAAGCRGL